MEANAEVLAPAAQLIQDTQYGRTKEVELLLDTPLSANIADDDGCTALHWAAINNRVPIAELLIAKGANVNIPGGILKIIEQLCKYIGKLLHISSRAQCC